MQALIGDGRERMGGVEANGRQHRRNLARERCLDPTSLRRRQVRAAHQMNADLAQRRQDLRIQQFVLARHQSARPLSHFNQGMFQRGGRRRMLRRKRFQPLFKLRNAHLEKLIKIRADDGQITQTLQRRHPRQLTLGKHAFVESEHRKLAVDYRHHARRSTLRFLVECEARM